MKKIKRILIALSLAIIMIFGVAGCNVGTQNDLQGKIDDLQSQIEDLNDRLAEMEDQISERDEKIEQLEKELAEKSLGTFYSLQEAYDKGYLTKTDLESIAHYLNEELSYTKALDSKIENAIKETAAYEIRNRGIEPFPEATADEFTIIAFYGVYSDRYVIRMRNNYDLVATDVPSYWEEIGGVQFHFVGYDIITVWREKEEVMLDENLEKIIKQDYMDQFGYEFRYDCFYGNYSDCAIFFVAGDSAVIKSITIAEQIFRYNYDWEIYVWKNGQFMTLEEAYSANWLTSENIKDIALRHNEFVKNA